jgi:hypothetical protein
MSHNLAHFNQSPQAELAGVSHSGTFPALLLPYAMTSAATRALLRSFRTTLFNS